MSARPLAFLPKAPQTEAQAECLRALLTAGRLQRPSRRFRSAWIELHGVPCSAWKNPQEPRIFEGRTVEALIRQGLAYVEEGFLLPTPAGRAWCVDNPGVADYRTWTDEVDHV